MITFERAQEFVGKEVRYMGKESTIKNVKELEERGVKMILAYTDLPLTINIEILKYKDEDEKWKFVE